MDNSSYAKQVASYSWSQRWIVYSLAVVSLIQVGGRLLDISKLHPLTFLNWVSLAGWLIPLAGYASALSGIAKAKSQGVLSGESAEFCRGLVTQLTMMAFMGTMVILSTR